MKNDRFLTWIFVFIAALVLAARVLFFTRGAEESYLAEDGPGAVVHNYALALVKGDFNRAYGYLAEGKDRPTQAEFRRAFSSGQLDYVGLRLGKVEITGEQAFVQVSVLHASRGLFDDGYSMEGSASLVLQAGDWKITGMPNPFWEYGWLGEKLRP